MKGVTLIVTNHTYRSYTGTCSVYNTFTTECCMHVLTVARSPVCQVQRS